MTSLNNKLTSLNFNLNNGMHKQWAQQLNEKIEFFFNNNVKQSEKQSVNNALVYCLSTIKCSIF